MELLLTGRVIDADEAQQISLVHRIADDVESAVYAWANELINLPRPALAALKALVYTASSASLAETNQHEAELFSQLYGQADHREALQAFLQKRPPRFNQAD
jgi:enoyl-CoA hydratase/carnithine racemase